LQGPILLVQFLAYLSFITPSRQVSRSPVIYGRTKALFLCALRKGYARACGARKEFFVRYPPLIPQRA